jgi:hypothetical protein
MQQITLEEIEAHRPDVLLPPDPEFAESYGELVAFGRERAAGARIAFVAICRNAMPWLPRTLALLEETGAMFCEWSAFIYENDSTDDTKAVLGEWHDGQQRQCSLNINGRPHLNYTTAVERTHALAEYRAECQRWVRDGEPVDYVAVFDTDPWGGWSVDGVATSIGHLVESQGEASCMASLSWAQIPNVGGPVAIHYDAFAARLNHWKQRDQMWFHYWLPPIGSPPVRFNSAFGQFAVYERNAYLAMRYSGEDCEHVCGHRTMPGSVYLNPSSRCVSFWVPNNGGQHSGD